jgi:hypothetical protein
MQYRRCRVPVATNVGGGGRSLAIGGATCRSQMASYEVFGAEQPRDAGFHVDAGVVRGRSSLLARCTGVMTEPSTNTEIYAGLRAAMIALARSLSAEEVALLAPQPPDWSIKDVVAHVVGIIDDILSDNVAAIGTNEWTAMPVSAR